MVKNNWSHVLPPMFYFIFVLDTVASFAIKYFTEVATKELTT